MKETPVFKFVSVRPPQLISGTSAMYFVRDPRIYSDLRTKLETTKVIKEKIKVAIDFIGSNSYIFNIEDYKGIIDSLIDLETVILKIDHHKEDDIEDKLEAPLDLVKKALENKENSFTQSLWDSYYAMLQLNSYSSEKRQEINSLIKSFYVFKSLVSDNKDRVKKQLLLKYNKITPVIVQSIFAKEKVKKAKDAGENLELEKQIERHKRRIEFLEESLLNINQLFQQKIRTLAETKNNFNRKDKSNQRPQFDLPWRVKLGDLHDDLNKFFLRIGIVPEFHNFPTLISSIEKLISQETLNLDILKQSNKLVIYNNRVGSSAQPMYSTAANVGNDGTIEFELPKLRVIGIGELQLVEQTLIRYDYEESEIAHIENILKGEYKDREHRTLKRTEENILSEVESVTEEEKDLQSTNRFELQKETHNEINTSLSLEAGFNMSAAYGPVQVGANAGFAYTDSRVESSLNSTNYARNLIERATSRIYNRVREERIERIIEEVEETNKHGIDNKAGSDHIRGVYRWVDKIYETKIMNYGKRLFLEFVIPEPAVFFLNNQIQNAQQSDGAIPLVALNDNGQALRPNDITRSNYLSLISRYKAKNAAPPPDHLIVISCSVVDDTGESKAKAISSKTPLNIPDGYQAISGTISMSSFPRPGLESTAIDILVGDSLVSAEMTVQNNGDYVPQWIDFEDAERIVPVSVVSNKAIVSAVHVSALCKLKPSKYEKWQMDTYNSIIEAVAEANSALSSEGIKISGKNPVANREIERTELKKSCIAVLRSDYFNDMGAINASNEVDFSKALEDGSIIQFFEQAFEWQNMTYIFYPYFWSRKPKWNTLFNLDDTDPKFTQFLKAGAVRIALPVHPSYNDSILHYLSTGQMWNGGSAPVIDDPLFISVSDELKNLSADGSTETKIQDGEAWEVKIPTSLIYLQSGAQDLNTSTP